MALLSKKKKERKNWKNIFFLSRWHSLGTWASLEMSSCLAESDLRDDSFISGLAVHSAELSIIPFPVQRWPLQLHRVISRLKLLSSQAVSPYTSRCKWIFGDNRVPCDRYEAINNPVGVLVRCRVNGGEKRQRRAGGWIFSTDLQKCIFNSPQTLFESITPT